LGCNLALSKENVTVTTFGCLEKGLRSLRNGPDGSLQICSIAKYRRRRFLFQRLLLAASLKIKMPVLVIDSIVDGTMGKCVICGKKGPLGMECSNCGEDSGGRYL
jgi:hypothetical protein